MSAFTLPITFRAVGCASTGAPFESIARSIDGLQADEVLVRVSYASINAMDGKVHQHNFPQLPLPFVLGYDFSGVLVAVGTPAALSGESESDGLTVGSEVMGSTFGIRYASHTAASWRLRQARLAILRHFVFSVDNAVRARLTAVLCLCQLGWWLLCRVRRGKA